MRSTGNRVVQAFVMIFWKFSHLNFVLNFDFVWMKLCVFPVDPEFLFYKSWHWQTHTNQVESLNSKLS